MTDRTYWAAEPDPKKLAELLRTRINRFRDSCERSGRRNLWARAVRTFYGLDPEGGYRRSHYVIFEGAQGEDLGSRANLFRAYVKSQMVMTTSNRPAFSCRPIAYDAQVDEVVTIGDAWLDKCLDDGVEAEGVLCMLIAALMGEGWLATTWNDMGGDVIGEEDVQLSDGTFVSRPLCAGAHRVLSLRPDEVVRDPDVTGGPKAHRWVAIAVQRDRWELMAQYPEYANEIRNAQSDEQRWIFGGASNLSSQSELVNGDCVITYELYHRKTIAMPEGLSALMVGDCIVSRSGLPYEGLPVHCALSDRDPGSSFGYGESWDMMAIQAVIDSVWMQMSTNQENLGRANLFMFTGTEIEPYNVGGTRLITGARPPEVVDLSTGGIESGKVMFEMSDTLMQRQTGMNEAALGSASSSASGVALAQRQQTAMQFNSPMQLGYVTMLQAGMTQLLYIAQRFMSDEQLIHIAGKNRAPMVKRFKGTDFKALDGVSVELGSASMRTSGMRHQIALELLEAGAISDPAVYLEMVATGRLDAALDGPRILATQADRLMLEVQEGRGYMVAATMPHEMMIQRLALLIADPSMSEAGVDPATGQPMQAKSDLAMQLVQQHGDLWTQMSMNPAGAAILMATGQKPAPGAAMMAPPMPGGPGPGAPPGAPPAPPNEPAPPGAPPNIPAPQDAPQPSPSGQANDGPAGQPSLPEGAAATA